MSGISFWIIDTETTGLVAKHHEITEISIIRFDNRMQLSRNIRCDYPERASIDALRITNKTMDDLSKGIDKLQAINDCNEFFAQDGRTKAHRCIVGHNIVNFDKKFLHALWEEYDQEFPADLFLDTMTMMKSHNKSLGNPKAKVNLDASCNTLGIKKFAGAHSARGDSRNTYLLFNKLLNEHNMDYLPFIKNIPHIVKTSNEDIDDLLASLNDEDTSPTEDID